MTHLHQTNSMSRWPLIFYLIMSALLFMLGCEDTVISTSSPTRLTDQYQEDPDMQDLGLPLLEDNVLGIASEDFFPEGITRSAVGDFYIGSVNTGSIVVVKQGQQWADEFIAGERFEGSGTAGLIADSAQGHLWACTGDFFRQQPSKIWRFDLLTGETQAQYELPEGSFCNDLTLDDQGRIYATDSFGGRIIRINNQVLDVWIEGTAYEPMNGSPLSLNGISWDPQGKIWFGRSDTGQLSSVSINSDGTAGEVNLDLLTLPEDIPPQSIDGLKWRSPHELIVVRGRNVYQLIKHGHETTSYHWEMNLIDDTLNHATTFAFDEDKASIWVVESQLSRLYQGIPPDLPFQVRQIPLPPMRSE